jgi:hypothetical protein
LPRNQNPQVIPDHAFVLGRSNLHRKLHLQRQECRAAPISKAVGTDVYVEPAKSSKTCQLGTYHSSADGVEDCQECLKVSVNLKFSFKKLVN